MNWVGFRCESKYLSIRGDSGDSGPVWNRGITQSNYCLFTQSKYCLLHNQITVFNTIKCPWSYTVAKVKISRKIVWNCKYFLNHQFNVFYTHVLWKSFSQDEQFFEHLIVNIFLPATYILGAQTNRLIKTLYNYSVTAWPRGMQWPDQLLS